MTQAKKHGSTRKSTDTSSTRGQRGRQEAPGSATPTLNERLRRSGKWVFLALAIVFGFGFVFAGVGTGGGLSLADLIGQSQSSAPTTTAASASEVQKAEAKAKGSTDPQAWLDYAQAAVAAGQLDAAKAAAVKAGELAPADAKVQGAVADVYLAVAGSAISKAQTLYADAQAKGLVNGRSPVPNQVIPGQVQAADPFQAAASSAASASSSDVMAKITPLQTQATDAYKAAAAAQAVVVKVSPQDPAAWFRLAQFQTAASDTAGAVVSYGKFVELAPDDPLAQKVKDEIAALKKQLKGSAGG
jgi:cytochrome c-type biogenesis protein CcmH/NrfG